MSRRLVRSVIVAALLGLGCSAVTAETERIVPANEEPRHVVKLQNEWVRIVDVEIPECEQTLYHTHSLDYPYVLVTSVTLFNQIYGEEAKDVKMQAGFIGFYNAATQGAYTHRFINRGPGTFRAIGIELMQPAAQSSATSAPLPALSGVETALDNDRVGAYRIKLAPGASVGPLTMPGPSIRVSLGDGKLMTEIEDTQTESRLTPAQFVFQPQTLEASFTNVGDTELVLVQFVLK